MPRRLSWRLHCPWTRLFAVEAGLSGDLGPCVGLLDADADISSLRALAVRRGLRSVLEGLKAGPWTNIGDLEEWVVQSRFISGL